MKIRMTKLLTVTAIILSTLAVSCSNNDNNSNGGPSNSQGMQGNSGSNANLTAVPQAIAYNTAATAAEEFFSSRDYRTTIESETPVMIKANGSSFSADGPGVTVSGNAVTITQEGTYIVSGTITDGTITVDMADDTHKAQIVLDNATLHSNSSAPIEVLTADKVFITTTEGSSNVITANIASGATSDAGIYSKSDMTLNGLGSLTLNITGGDGIVGNDELTITSGTYHITTDGHGLDANDSIAIAGGEFTVFAQKDGMHCEHKTNESKGNIFIQGGSFVFDVGQDGMDASGFLEIQDGNFDITTCGGSEAAPVKTATSNSNGRGQQTTTVTQTEDNTPSTKGIKSVGELRLYGGTFVLDCYEDSIHSDSRLYITAGDYTLSTGDDGIHANWDCVIMGGNINILTSFEGLEAQRVVVSGGNITMLTGDDGINSTSNNPDPDNSDVYIYISGGRITIDSNKEGDGLDANGTIHVTGGDILVSSTTDQRDTSLDADGGAIITGGTFFATGSNSGTAQNFNANSTQGSIFVSLSAMQTGRVTLTDSKDNVIADFDPVKEYQAVTLSSPEIVEGETYTLVMGSQTQSIQMDSLIYGTGNSSGRR